MNIDGGLRVWRTATLYLKNITREVSLRSAEGSSGSLSMADERAATVPETATYCGMARRRSLQGAETAMYVSGVFGYVM
jgi:hypothetical protein